MVSTETLDVDRLLSRWRIAYRLGRKGISLAGTHPTPRECTAHRLGLLHRAWGVE